MRTLAIDLGTKRIGLAMSDAAGKFASPLDNLFVTDPAQAIAPIAQIVRREGVARVVVGLPLNMDESVGPAARGVLDWARRLAEQIHLEPIFVDERLSSFAAEQQLNDRKRAGEKLTRGKKKARLDAMAAAGFLQEFLDGTLRAVSL